MVGAKLECWEQTIPQERTVLGSEGRHPGQPSSSKRLEPVRLLSESLDAGRRGQEVHRASD
jgi:hypothetical protein